MAEINKYMKAYIGKKYFRLTVKSLDRTEKLNGKPYNYFRFICDCGNETISEIYNVKSGKKQSCGCKRDGMNSTHRMAGTRIYKIWAKMRARCKNPNDKRFDRYGGRGISVCKEWDNNFLPFYDWAMSNGYEPHLSIDRINNDGNYEPSNCRWATTQVQANNTSKNHYIEYNGERLTVTDWSLRLCNHTGLVTSRIYELGWDEIKAVTTPVLGHGYTLKHQVYKKDL